MSWQPQQQGLQELLEVLRQANSGNNAVQVQVQQIPTEPENVRAVAGIILKNKIKTITGNLASLQTIDYLKSVCLASIGDATPLVRNTITSIITTIAAEFGIKNWPALLPTLLQNLDSQDYNTMEGALGALEKILEDSGPEFRELREPSDYIAQKLIQMSDSSLQKIRIHSLVCYNLLIEFHVAPALQRIQEYVQALSKRATDQVGEVRALVCRAFVHILDVCPEVLLPSLSSVAEFMLFAAQDDNSDVALDACEFWLAFGEHDELKDHLESLVNRLIPILMKNMVYSEYDISILGGDEDDDAVPDRDQDIKPRHYKAKTHAVDAGDESDDAEDDDDDEIYAEWNLRKCSAATLDVLSNLFGDAILTVLLPLLNEQLLHTDWKVREAGVLALGAIAEGCTRGVEPHLPQLIPFLFQTLNHPKPLVRSITCWTLSRYSAWCITQDPNLFFEPLLKGLLSLVLDKNKRVQEAACSALATLEEDADALIIPYIDHILPVLTNAFTRYQSKNLLILYDAIGTLAESSAGHMVDGKYADLLMPPLIQKWNELPDDNSGLFPLLECLSAVAIAFGKSFYPFAAPVYERCIRLIKKCFEQQNLFEKDHSAEAPDKDFIVVSLDLISGLVQGLGPLMESLFTSHGSPTFFELLYMCLQDPVDEVRQSAFALVGDLALSCFEFLKPHLSTYLPILVHHCQPQGEMAISAANNASWATGEIALRSGAEIHQFIPALLERLVPLLNHEEIPRTLRENCAITIGRLAVNSPALLAPHLHTFAPNWCKCLKMTRDNAEKESAFVGFCNLIRQNPNGMLPSYALFCDCVGNWQKPSPALFNTFKDVLSWYKSSLGPEWEKLAATLSPQVRQRLSEVYLL